MKGKLTKTSFFFAAATAFFCVPAAAENVTENGNSVAINTEFKIEDDSSSTGNWDFTGISFTTAGTASAVLSTDGNAASSAGASSNQIDVAQKNLYFTGGNLTLTGANLSAATPTGGKLATYRAFVVEHGTVTFGKDADGNAVQISELGLNLCVGTAYSESGAAASTLNISDGASVKTSAYYSTVGANGSKGTVNISDSGSTLATQQITLGGATEGLTAAKSTLPQNNGYWNPVNLMTDAQYQSVMGTITAGTNNQNATNGARGEINISNGGTMTVGVGNTDVSTNKLQIMNGKISVDGVGSSLILGEASSLSISGNYGTTTKTTFENALAVTNGGSVKSEDGKVINGVQIGAMPGGSSTKSSLTVSGDNSVFDVASYSSATIGYSTGSQTGGNAEVNVSASNSAKFSLSSVDGVYVAYDGAQSDGQKVNISVESGAEMSLKGGTVQIGGNAPATGKENSVTVTTDGESSKLNIEAAAGKGVYLNASDAENVKVDFVVKNGAEVNFKTSAGASGADDPGTNFNKNSTITIEGASSMNTAGKVVVENGSAITLDSAVKWTSDGEITLNQGSVLNLSVSKDASGNVQQSQVATSALNISDGAKIAVTIDLTNMTEEELADFSVSLISLTGDDKTTGSSSLSTVTTAMETKFVSNGVDVTSQYADSLTYDSETGAYKLAVLSVPEPSAFGLLAGLGALALVASRRRRSRK